MNIFNKCREIFEACGDSRDCETFKDQLNCDAGKLFFSTIVSMVVLLFYIQTDMDLHPFPRLTVTLRLGLTLVSATLIALKFTKRFRNRPDIMLTIMGGYLNFSEAIISATAGENVTSYIGCLSLVIMVSTFIPMSLYYRLPITIISLATFFIVGALNDLSFWDIETQNPVKDLFVAVVLNLSLSMVLDRIKYISWQRLQKSEDASKAKSEFLSNMSHEIRTPMNAITGMAELALNENISNAAREHIITIKKASKNLLSIINEIQDFSEEEQKDNLNNITVKFSAPKAKILIVDDIETNLKVAEGLMRPYKMQIDLRLSGFEAIKAIKANNYDIVFMDHMMPEMDGIETTKQIRKMGGYTELPIIALTANTVSGAKGMFLANGFDDFMSKPIDTVKLNAMLAKWLPEKKREKAPEIVYESKSNVDLEIDGIDVKKGLAMVGGDLKIYMEILSTFYRDGVNKINEIKKCLETNNYNLYTIYVHALKSASANIGALDLSEMAKSLEMAGKQLDLAYIKLYNPDFLKALEALLNNIDIVLSKNKKEQGPVDYEALKIELSNLKKAVEIFEFDAIDKAVNALKEFSQVTEVENILQKILIGEYEEVATIISAMEDKRS